MSVQSNQISFFQTTRLKTGYLLVLAGQSNGTDRFAITGNLNTLYQGTQPNVMTFYKTANTSAANGSWVQASAGVNTTTAGGIAGSFNIGVVAANRLINTYGSAGYIVPTAVGGTAIADAATTSWNVSHATGIYSQDLYARMLNHFTQAVASIPVGTTLTPVLVWVHGEADSYIESYANAYYTNVFNLITQFRVDSGYSSMKVVITKLRSDFDPTAAYQAAVKQAQIDLAANMTGVYLYDTNTALTPLWTDFQHYCPSTDATYGGVQSATNLGNEMADLISTF